MGKLVFLSLLTPYVLERGRRCSRHSATPEYASNRTTMPTPTPREKRLVTALVSAVTQWPDADPSAYFSDIANVLAASSFVGAELVLFGAVRQFYCASINVTA